MSQVGPKSNDMCLIKEEEKTQMKRGESRDRDWSYEATNQGMPEGTRNLKVQGGTLPWSLWRECGPASMGGFC